MCPPAAPSPSVPVPVPTHLPGRRQSCQRAPSPGERRHGGAPVFIACGGGGEGRCHHPPDPPAVSLIKPVLLISGNERNLGVKLSSSAC